MAHLLEHMLFMGSKNYPTEDEYNEHFGLNGGYCNAFTEFEQTNYYFEVNYSGFEKALDLLTSAVAEPLLLEQAIDREINAVESEYRMWFTCDIVRCL